MGSNCLNGFIPPLINKLQKVFCHDKNVIKRQVILLRDKLNIGYNFVPFLSLTQKHAWQSII